MHLADGSMNVNRISRAYQNFSASHYYNYLLDKHNITRAKFDSCVLFYIEHTQEYEQLYDQVIDSLNKFKTKLSIDRKQYSQFIDSINLYKGKKEIRIPKTDSIINDMKIHIEKPGKYIVQAQYRFTFKDRGKFPYLKLYLRHKNDTAKISINKVIASDSVRLVRNSRYDLYQTVIEKKDSIPSELFIDFISCTNDKSEKYKKDRNIKEILIYRSSERISKRFEYFAYNKININKHKSKNYKLHFSSIKHTKTNSLNR